MFAACKALAPKLSVGVETLRKWVVQAQIDAGVTVGPTTVELKKIKKLKAENRDLREPADPKSDINFLRDGARPSPPLICALIDEMRTDGHGVEPTCQVVLREQGLAVSSRSYRAWRTRPAATRAHDDAAILTVLHHIRQRDAQGRHRPEVLEGRRKMTAWLRRKGLLDHRQIEVRQRTGLGDHGPGQPSVVFRSRLH